MADDPPPLPEPRKLPVVVTAEEVFLYSNGGSFEGFEFLEDIQRRMEATHDIEAKLAILNERRARQMSFLSAEKLAILQSQQRDPESVVRQLQDTMSRRIAPRNVNWFERLRSPRFRENQPPPENSEAQQDRGNPHVAVERDTIVQFVRDAAKKNALPIEDAVRVLAEAGESLTWVDSVPDRLIMNEPIVPTLGSPTERRKLLALYYRPLAELMAEQNTRMCERLAECNAGLAAGLQERLAGLDRHEGPGGPLG